MNLILFIIFCLSALIKPHPNIADSNLAERTQLLSFPEDDYCSGVYKIDLSKVAKGQITSDASNLPRNYVEDSICEWTLYAPKGNIIKFTFSYSYTECQWDFIRLYNGENKASPQLAAISGNREYNFSTPNIFRDSVLSTQNKMHIVFNSDQRVVSHGFSGVFELIDPKNSCKSDEDCGSLEDRGVCQLNTCKCNRIWKGIFCEESFSI